MSPPTTLLSPSRVSHTGGGTASAFQARIIDFCFSHGIDISNAKARKLGVRIARRAESMQAEFDFDRELRVLGIHWDPTAADAIYNVERNAASPSET